MTVRMPALCTVRGVCVVACATLVAGLAQAQPTLRELSDAGGQYLRDATGVSDNGVVCGWIMVGTNEHAALWTLAGGVEDLGVPAGMTKSKAAAISKDGVYVVGRSGLTDVTGPHYFDRAFRWSRATGLQLLAPLATGQVTSVGAVALDGTAVGRSGRSAALWNRNGDPIALPGLSGASDSGAVGISDDGAVVVGTSTFESISISRPWKAGPWNSLAYNLGALLGGDETLASAVGGSGSVVLATSYLQVSTQSFLWDGGCDGRRPIPVIAGFDSCTMGCINGNGTVVGGFLSTGSSRYRAAVWDTRHGTQALDGYLASRGVDTSGWVLYNVTAVSSDGSVLVGTGSLGSRLTSFIVRGLDCECAPPRCPTDLNRDGNSDAGDIEILINSIGTLGWYCFDQDINRDGNVDQDDISFLVDLIAGGDCPF